MPVCCVLCVDGQRLAEPDLNTAGRTVCGETATFKILPASHRLVYSGITNTHTDAGHARCVRFRSLGRLCWCEVAPGLALNGQDSTSQSRCAGAPSRELSCPLTTLVSGAIRPLVPTTCASLAATNHDGAGCSSHTFLVPSQGPASEFPQKADVGGRSRIAGVATAELENTRAIKKIVFRTFLKTAHSPRIALLSSTQPPLD
ncbi:hypothetical protein B0T25DRAFT_341714 [Lasiosphaeria hispida]|uniref:Uncharacterized protein n=1 Tax=Lasiosphaeria hispida TaxID=260671 RepID=A0AAJ0M838_9PEZI|nr:hypothetical protein B0T25DRAFT_341714 [Lasiosphaeria hispida]